MELQCPKCHSKAFKKNGFTRHGKQNHRCLDCGRQFSTDYKAPDQSGGAHDATPVATYDLNK